jgi:hypothetical protein
MNLYNCSEQNASVREIFLVENTLTICILTIANNDKEGKIYPVLKKFRAGHNFRCPLNSPLFVDPFNS